LNKTRPQLVIVYILCHHNVFELKKLQYILFAAFFTVLTVVISISKHYSGGELYSFALYSNADSCCQVPSDCCDDESEIIQFIADYVFSANTHLDHNAIVIDLFADCLFTELLNCDEVNDIVNLSYRTDIHPPRKVNIYLSQTQAYLL